MTCTAFQAVDLELARVSKGANGSADSLALLGSNDGIVDNLQSALLQLRADILDLWDLE